MEKEKINQMFVIIVIMVLLIFVVVFIVSTLLSSKEDKVDKLQVKFNQIYSSDYELRAIDDKYFIGSYEKNIINVIIDNNGQEIYKGNENIYYENIYKTKNDEYIIYNNIDNKLNVYLFDGEKMETLYNLDNVSYIKPVIYKGIDQEYIVCFVSVVNDDLYIYSLDNIGMKIIDDVSLMGDQINDNFYYIYNDEYLVVKNKEEKMGVIDLFGEVVIDYKYDNILNTYNNSFIVLDDSKYGIIDEHGEKLLKSSYKAIYDFGNYYIVVNTKNKMALYNEEYDNLTGFKMDYDSLIPFDLRGSVRSVMLYKVNGKIVVVNNYLEDVNKTEYDKHDFYIINGEDIQKEIEQIGFGCGNVVYTYDDDYKIKIYDNYFETILEYKLNNVSKVEDILLVGNNLYQAIYYDNENKLTKVYIDNDGQERDYDLGTILFDKTLYTGFIKEEDNLLNLTMYDKNLEILDTLEGKYIDNVGDYVVVDNSIYKIVVV